MPAAVQDNCCVAWADCVDGRNQLPFVAISVVLVISVHQESCGFQSTEGLKEERIRSDKINEQTTLISYLAEKCKGFTLSLSKAGRSRDLQ